MLGLGILCEGTTWLTGYCASIYGLDGVLHTAHHLEQYGVGVCRHAPHEDSDSRVPLLLCDPQGLRSVGGPRPPLDPSALCLGPGVEQDMVSAFGGGG